jgi:hypothetical protein
MLTQEEISMAGHAAVLKSGMPIDMHLRLAGGTYAPPDEDARPIISIKVVATDDGQQDFSVHKVLLNQMTSDTLEVYLLGFLQGVMETLEEAEARMAAEMIGPGAQRIH